MKRLLLLLVAAVAVACQQPVTLTLIPQPEVATPTGGTFTPTAPLTVAVDNEAFAAAVDYLDEALMPAVVAPEERAASACLRITTNEALTGYDAYRLDITRAGISIEAATYGGVVAAIATLRQLALDESLPCCHIEDAARFSWRGVHLDVSRHFFDKEEVKRYIDFMALYKFNRFHWHLVDDQGWRIEIDRYPELTARAAWREMNNQDEECLRRAETECDDAYRLPADKMREADGKQLYGGYYTKDDVREIVAYAALRGIDVIPEIDMPGHSQCPNLCYPHLSCFGKTTWGEFFSAPLCLGRESTIEFAKNVFDEIFELFPYAYVHIGGDEVDMTNWKRCPDCQARILREGLSGEKELQGWFIHRMADYFAAHGRKLIGWDEIVEGGLRDDEAVMWWRGWAPDTFRRSVERGNETLISYSEYLYLDGAQSANSLEKVFSFEPDDLLEGGLPSNVVGLQCHLWTEYVPSWTKLGQRIFPRMFAVSEVAWCRHKGDFAPFKRRAYAHMEQILEPRGMAYRLPDLTGVYDRNVMIGRVHIGIPQPSMTVHYTLDGSIPTAASPRYVDGLDLPDETLVRFRTFSASGIPGESVVALYVPFDEQPTCDLPLNLAEGLHVDWYDYTGELCAEIDSVPHLGEVIAPSVCIPESVHGNIGLVFTGYIEVPESAIYTFRLNSDDGSYLEIDGVRIIDNDTAHSALERCGQVALAKGLHRLDARYFDHNGGCLEFGEIAPDGGRVPLREGIRFYHEGGA